jgi:hypothetical protein
MVPIGSKGFVLDAVTSVLSGEPGTVFGTMPLEPFGTSGTLGTFGVSGTRGTFGVSSSNGRRLMIAPPP